MTNSTTSDNSRLRSVTFSLCGLGWLYAELLDGEQSTTFSASWLGDSLPELLDASLAAAKGAVSTRAEWSDEPTGTLTWVFERAGELLHLSVWHNIGIGGPISPVLEVEGPSPDVISIVTDACVNLIHAVGEVAYFNKWGTPFPTATLREVQRAVAIPVLEERPFDPLFRPPHPLRAEISNRWEALFERRESRAAVGAWSRAQSHAGDLDGSTTAGLNLLLEASAQDIEDPRGLYEAWDLYSQWIGLSARHDDIPGERRRIAQRMRLTWLLREVGPEATQLLIATSRRGLSDDDVQVALARRSSPEYDFEPRSMRGQREWAKNQSSDTRLRATREENAPSSS